MRRLRGFVSIWIFAAICGLADAAAGDDGCRSAATLARSLFEGANDRGTFEITSGYSLDEDLLVNEGRLRATVAARLDGPSLRRLADVRPTVLCVSLVLDAEGELPVAHHQRISLPPLGETGDLGGATAWTYGLEVDLPETASQLLVLIEEPASGLWGAAIADDAGEAITRGPSALRLADDAWVEITSGAAAATSPAASPAAPTVVRLVPPRRQPVTGGTRFDALVSSTAVARIVFELDGEQVATRQRSSLLGRPFAARIELADPPRVQTLRAVAFDTHGRELGSDTLVVNQIDAPLRVRILELSGDPAAGSVEVAAEVTVPVGARLERIEVYHNVTLVARFDRPQARYRVPTPDTGPEDYVRIAAFLTDGSSIDDVVLLGAGEVEEVDVNLVELHVVATGDDGQPVADLTASDFQITFEGRPQPTQSFAYADDVTLLLGVVIDTSGSMQLVMEDTRKAAAKFLGSTVLPQDRAFLVDFDLQPRLLHPTTSDLPALLMDLHRLVAEGATALYDATVFSMLQFEREGGRKALVILTDGDDHESRFGPKYCIELAHKTGVPIYIVGLGALDTIRRTYSKKELRRVTSETGGRLYIVDSLAELDEAYAQINAELRSQYSLSFYADRDLDDAERREVEVEIGRPGLHARTVVGKRQTSP